MQFMTREDARIAYERLGDGPPVLFIQGAGVPRVGWRPQLESLHEHLTCVAYDHPGLGDSGEPTRPVTIPRLVHEAVELLDHLGWPSAHLVGHSMGGIIAHQLALAHPERVRSLSLLCTFAYGKQATRPTLKMAWVGTRSMIGTRRSRRRAWLEMILAPSQRRGQDPDALAATYGEIFGRDLADTPGITREHLKAMGDHALPAGMDALASVPSLVVSGAHDIIARPAYGEQLARLISADRYVELDDAAHGLTVTHRTEVDRMLLDHILAADPHD